MLVNRERKGNETENVDKQIKVNSFAVLQPIEAAQRILSRGRYPPMACRTKE